jgi:hypothetical protein
MFISLLLCFKKFGHGTDESIRREIGNTKLMVSVIEVYAHKTETLQLNVLKLCNLMRKWLGNKLKYMQEKYRIEGKGS